MKAAILKDWKRVEVTDIPPPVPAPGEVLINVAFAGICGSDVHIYNGYNPIARVPVIPGHEFTGRVAALGEGVDGLTRGARAAIQPLISCGACPPCRRGSPHVCEKLIVIGVNRNGGFAEQAAVPADCVFPIPDALSDEAAALAEPFSIATHSLKRGSISSSDRALIIGAGPISLYCALTARHLGTKQVQVSEPNSSRRAVAESFGIATINPNEGDAIGRLRNISENEGFDLVIETSGTAAGFETATKAAAVHGRIVMLGFPQGGQGAIHVTQCIVKELSLIGSRVCTRQEFQDTLDMLTKWQVNGNVDFERLIVAARSLSDLAHSILDVEKGTEVAKILIKPV